ncbi:iron-sulfur cluster repair di-iron protein [Catalinimonas niigatensis]|uniref:iron-sulfur cluster repair di-iron protein n=1 Tax=Catalinimonas niigatensis TaxID=1397264 RepID=UPI0026658B04|nr:iron-sulfur cluster repair di-iron protein [Catalinimonas niigatensis]WPP47984.1 iron-sulfur cluster repair di-iron protein [Catalinimonas niigatensis]
MNTLMQEPVGQIVNRNYRTADVFKKFGIDFCCGGKKPLQEACEKKNIDPKELEQVLLKVLNQTQEEVVNYSSWPLDLLADYIEKKHHRYVEENIPLIQQYLHKVASVHGDHHPELIEVYQLFNQCAEELGQHMQKEEQILFPYIRQLVKAQRIGSVLEAPHFGTVENPIAMMEHEHDAEGNRFARIAALCDQYNPPADACNTYKVTFAKLEEFESDLHTHIHLENNILFPQVIALEKKLNTVTLE